MPSQRKRIGFLPSEEVHEIIDKLCKANKFSQSKVTGLLVEEALRSRGVLGITFHSKSIEKSDFSNYYLEDETIYKNNKNLSYSDDNTTNNKIVSENIKMMHEFIEYKYFKKVMKQNNNILE